MRRRHRARSRAACVSSRPSALTRMDFARCGIWVLAQTVSAPSAGSKRARIARASSEWPPPLSSLKRMAMRCAARANAASMSPYLTSVLGDEIVGTIEPRARRTGRQALDRIGDRRKRIGIDVDQAHRVFGDGAALGDDERDRLADISELVARERIGIDGKADRRGRQRQAECGRRSDAGADRHR